MQKYSVDYYRRKKREENKMIGSKHEKDKINFIESFTLEKYADIVDKMLEDLGTQKTIFHLEITKQRIIQKVIEQIENEE